MICLPVRKSTSSDFLSTLIDAHGVDEHDAAARHDALFEGGTGGVEGVLDAVLGLLHLDLGGRADLDDGDAAGQLGETLLELLAVEVGVGGLDLALDLLDATLDLVGVAGAVDDRRVVLGDDDLAGAAELRDAACSRASGPSLR